MVKLKSKKGDTLIEVMLAVGIFSMVAIAVVSVVSGSTSSAQTALEATLAREEIDAQAEAIRFIHDSYLADRNGEGNEYREIWSDIVSNTTQSIADNYPPTSCDDLYSGGNNIFGQNAFVIDTHKLGKEGAAGEVYVEADNGNIFRQASTYPRLVFTGGDSLAEEGKGDTLSSVEGIYVVAVKDPSTTNIVDKSTSTSTSAYYDFYIRTCWYGTGDREASTISTVIRLYDPAITEDLDK